MTTSWVTEWTTGSVELRDQLVEAQPNTGNPFGPICGGGMKHGGMPGAYGGTHG
ncbi:hypothetical protein [Mycobacterium sp. DL99]|uniref:hypothetical protein n=1 Tax=Mycobacterium sp. DL99 TaxID=2528957 RepID=UPI001436A369|nr:hypothetical protein [Mycobacterium sp. DL99]